MGRRRMLPSRDPPVRAGTVAQCRREPRRRSLAASADFANFLGAVAAACGHVATAGVGCTALSAAFAACSSNRCPGRRRAARRR
jgi:hypothetical protein